MLEHLEWKSLEQRRKDARLTMMYKITNEKVAIPKEGRLRLAYSTNGRTNALYAFCFTFPSVVEPMFRLRFRNPIVLFALLQMLLT
jgi:hypothetical protein